jgi:four helix bundle protein
MKLRTRQFAIDVIRFARGLPRIIEIEHLKQQLVDAATSTSDNYRSATRARSHAEFASRLGTVLDEADESEHWLTVLYEANVGRSKELDRLRSEATELRSIFAKSVLTANENEQRRRRNRER